MIKGINKQIIEIKCINDEYFEKILLFVKGDKTDSPNAILQNQAKAYCSVLACPSKRNKKKKYLFLAMWYVFMVAVGGGLGVVISKTFF